METATIVTQESSNGNYGWTYAPPAEMTSVVAEITPEIAGDWLALAGKNRRIDPAVVTEYATAMERGEWSVTGEAIKFSKAGRLIDGQHRLSAVVKSGVTIRSLVVYGVEQHAFDVMDSGKKRKASDVLGMHDYEMGPRLATAAGFLVTYGRIGEFMGGRGHRAVRASKVEILRYVQSHPGLTESVRATNSARIGGLSQGLLGALHFLFSDKDEDLCAEFFTKLLTGANLASDDPVFALRRRLLDNAASQSRLSVNVLAAFIIKAWNATRMGKPLAVLRFRSGGQNPEPFPAIV